MCAMGIDLPAERGRIDWLATAARYLPPPMPDLIAKALPLVPFANTLPGIAIVLLCLGMAERDGVLILVGYFATLVATIYVFGLLLLVVYAGLNFDEVWQTVRGWLS